MRAKAARDIATRAMTPLTSHINWDIDGFSLTDDGKWLAFVANENGVSNIWLQSPAGGAPRQLTRFGEGQIFYFDWTSTGDLLVSHGAVTSNVVMIEGFR